MDAAQIDAWADNPESRLLFPELIRRLMAATPGVSATMIRTGAGIDWSGWDGTARSAEASFLPNGSLKLEFGTSKRPKVKADKDWAERLEGASLEDVFVFATPRRWPGAQAWAAQRNREHRYASVSVLDADTIAAWLIETPSVHYWFSERLGRHPGQAHSLEGWWREFSSSTEPAVPVQMFTSGRDKHSAALRAALSESTARVTTIRCEWHKDALGFLYGTLAGDDGATMPVVIIETPEVFAAISAQPAEAVLVPMFDDAQVNAALVKGHHVVQIIDDTATTRSAIDITLPRLSRTGTVEAFTSSGIEFHQAQEFTGLARRNLQAFVRSISKNKRFAHPDWAAPGYATSIARLCLIGRWTIGAGDVALLERFTHKPADELDDLLQRFSGADPVFRRVGRLWQLTSPREAFALLAPTMSERARLMQEWAELAVTVLSEPDPVLDLPEDEQHMAGLREIRRSVSPALRSGIARGVALVGVLGRDEDDASSSDGHLSDHAEQVVRQLTATAIADPSGRRWRELCDVLVLLAEAAPQLFLQAVLTDLRRPDPVLVTLFDDGDSSQPAFGRTSPHVYLLWALETLCWSTDHLPDAVRALAMLSDKDPGGRSGNRPLGSLSTSLCGWMNHTSATQQQRIAALEDVRRHWPKVAWQLLFALWPSAHAVAFPPHYPYLARWLPDDASVTMSTWTHFVHRLVDIAIELVQDSPARIAELVEHLGETPREDQARILATLTEITARAPFSSDERFEVWKQLDALITKHQHYPDAAWSYTPDQLEEISSAAAQLAPTDDPRRFADLFGWHPDIAEVDPEDYPAQQERLEQLRGEAIADLLALPEPMHALALMTRTAPAPGFVGGQLAQQPRVSLHDMLGWLSSQDAALATAARVWVHTRATAPDGPAWLRASLDDPALLDTARARLLEALPTEHAIWTVVEVNDADAAHYWSAAKPYAAKQGEDEQLAEQLLKRHRAWAAVNVLSSAVHRALAQHGTQAKTQRGADTAAATPTGPSVELISKALWQAVGEEPAAEDFDTTISYGLGRILDYLVARGTDEQTMAQLEFAYYRVLEHTRPARALDAALASQPEMFVQLVTLAFTSKDPKAPTPSERDRQLGRQAFWVLRTWHGFPGRAVDGSVDPQLLDRWLQHARFALSESGRADIGDELIGQAFAYAPRGADGAWPPEPIREAIERIGSTELDNGLVIGRFNSRGVTTRAAFEGGNQERTLAEQYRGWAKLVRANAPRTSAALTALAEDYDRDATREDVRAEIDADET